MLRTHCQAERNESRTHRWRVNDAVRPQVADGWYFVAGKTWQEQALTSEGLSHRPRLGETSPVTPRHTQVRKHCYYWCVTLTTRHILILYAQPAQRENPDPGKCSLVHSCLSPTRTDEMRCREPARGRHARHVLRGPSWLCPRICRLLLHEGRPRRALPCQLHPLARATCAHFSERGAGGVCELSRRLREQTQS